MFHCILLILHYGKQLVLKQIVYFKRQNTIKPLFMYLFFDFSILAFRKRTIKDLFHGCTYANFDSTQKLIDASHKCLVPTDKCFWKDPCDITTQIATWSMTKNVGAVPLNVFNKYFKDKGKDQKTMIWFNLCIFYFKRLQ